MIKKSIFIVILIISTLLAGLYFFGQIEFRSNKYGLAEVRIFDLSFGLTDTFDDGPYIFIKEDSLVEKSILAGEVNIRTLPKDAFATDYSDEKSKFNNVKRVAALSDIHGQYDIFSEILRANKIVDKNLDWSFGDGHLVIVGDIFDRGAEVLQTLWFVYRLEIQAEKVGGKVHYLLGNHEYMVLHGNLKWLNGKYHRTADLLGREYQDLFAEDTVLGAWLRTKPTIIEINDTIYVHGGFSKEFLSHNYSIDEVNSLYRKSIDMTTEEIEANSRFSVLHSKSSPIWYRGYFTVFRQKPLSMEEVNEVLAILNNERMVVGHTSNSKIAKLNNGEIYAVDSTIKARAEGDILFIEESGIYRGSFTGERFKLD